MSEHAPEFLDLCAAWALGSLDEGDRRRLEEHVARGCPQCSAAMADFSAASVLVAASAPSAAPSPALRERVLRSLAESGDGRVGSPSTVRPAPARAPSRPVVELPRRGGGWSWVPLAAAAALALSTAFLGLQSARQNAELAATRQRLAELEKRAQDDLAWNQVLGSPHARISLLAPTTAGDPQLRGRATYDPATQRAVVVFDNLTPPSGRDYELWVIRDGIPASLGVLQPDADGRAVLRLESLGLSPSLSAFAVSLEPKGGSPTPNAPSGPVVLLGELSS